MSVLFKFVSAVLAVNWSKLRKEGFSSEAFNKYIRDPLLKITSTNVAVRVLTIDTVNPQHIMQEISKIFLKYEYFFTQFSAT